MPQNPVRRRPPARPPQRRRAQECRPPSDEPENTVTASGEIGRARRRRRAQGRGRNRRPSSSEEEDEEVGADPEVKKAKANLHRKKQIAKILRRAKRRRRRVLNLKVNQPVGWAKAVERLKRALKADMDALKALGWKPRKPAKGGASDEGEELDDEPEPTDAEVDDGGDDPTPDDGAPGTEGERDVEPTSWLDAEMFGRDAWKPLAAIEALGAKVFAKPVPLGEGAIVRARRGFRVVQLQVRPGLYLVTVATEAAVRQLRQTAAEGDVGFLPLVFAPRMIDAAKHALAPHPAPGRAVAPPAAPAAAPANVTGCDGCPHCGPRRS